LQRTLTLKTTIAIVIGGVIGSGIFMKPAIMSAQLGTPLALVAVWIVAGLITLFGALSNAEVASMFPETGGQYIFFQKMYGSFFAYLYGWAAFAVFNTAGNASIAYVCAEYANFFLHLPRFSSEMEHSVFYKIPYIGTFYILENAGVKMLTIALLGVFTYLNHRSVSESAALQRFLTALKTIAIVLLILGLYTNPQGNIAHFNHRLDTAPQGWAFIAAFVAALSGAFWAYDGWNNITFIAGEIIEPQRNISKSLIIGLLSCIAIYVMINIAFVYMLPITEMAASSFVAAAAATAAWGAWGGILITLLVVFSTLGTANANILATARITFALGQENKTFSYLGKVHPTLQTPSNALKINLLWSSFLVLSGSFDMLTDMLIFVTWFFYGASAFGLFLLRFKMPDRQRPYRVWGYPIVPFIFVSFTAFFLIATLITDIQDYQAGKTNIIKSLLGIVITLLGLLFYRKSNEQTH
jgi:basic amino acid/polyamine antiporter, APA family